MNNTIDAKTRTARAAATLPPHAGRLRRKLLPVSLSLLLVSPFVFGGEALAAAVGATSGPTGGTVVGGIGSITQNGANTVINQNSAKLALDWQTFNVGKDASVLFKQPSFTAVALNRILDQNPSQIFGHISSNGQVFLINTHGIIFGASAQMNVGGLMASTLDLTPKDFLASRYNLDAHGVSAGIVNHGLIKAASGGSVSLVGGSVANDGVILANYGRINLDGADRAVLDFDGNGLINIQVTGALQQRLDSGEAAVSNKGTLKADSGTVVLQASAAKDLFTNLVNNNGVIDAGGISTSGGVVRLVASGGNTENSGAINVSGVQGGSVQVLSDRNVSVTGSIDASGRNGGGSIRVGGGYQGGEGLQAAAVTYVGPDARLNADAVESGNGGSVVLWSNTATGFKGNISARGGASGGNGGMAEVSSRGYLAFAGTADLRAPGGAWGTLLLDPNDITISDDADDNPASPGGFDASGDFTAEDSTAVSTINTTTIVNQLGSSDVKIKTADGDITVANGFTYDGDDDRTLTLDAAGTLTFKSGATIESTGGTGGAHTLGGDLTGAGGVVFETGSSFITNGGNLVVKGGAFTLGGALDAGAGTVALNSGGAISQTSGVIIAGTLTGASTGNTTLGGNNAIAALGDFTAANFTLNNAATGLLTLGGTLEAGAAAGGDPVAEPETAGNINVMSAGAITQGTGGAFDTHGGNITLTGNALTLGAVDARSSSSTPGTAGNVVLNATGGAAQFGRVEAGSLEVTAAGDITQASAAGDALHVSGTSHFAAGTHDITLGNTGNQLAGYVELIGGDVTLVNDTATLLSDTTVTGALNLETNGSLTQVGGVTVDGTATFTQNSADTDGADITLGTDNAYLNGAVVFAGNIDNLTLHNHTLAPGALTLPASVAGNLTLKYSDAALSLPSTNLSVGGALELTAADGITLHGDVTTAGGQNYASAVTLGHDVTLTDTGSQDITFGGTVDGGYGLTVSTDGLADFVDAVGGGIGLTSLTTGAVRLGGNVTTTGAQTYGGTATIFSGTPVVLTTNDSAVTFGGTLDNSSDAAQALTVNAGNGAVTFTGAVGSGIHHALGDLIVTSAGLTDFRSTVQAASLTTDAGGSTQLAGNVTTAGKQTYHDAVVLDGDVTLETTGDDLVFGTTVDNADASTPHSLVVKTTGHDLTFTGAVGSLNGPLQGLTTSGGRFTANSSLDIGAGGLDITTTLDGIGQGGAFTVAGLSKFNAGSSGVIDLGNADNHFADKVDLTGGSATIVDSGTLTLGTVSLGGALTVTSHGALNLGSGSMQTLTATSNDGAIIQAGDLTTNGTGDSIDAGAGTITLTSSGNTFDGVAGMSLTGGATSIVDAHDLKLGVLDTGALTVNSMGALDLGSGTVDGVLTATSGGDINQSGALTVTGTSSIDAGAASITLGDTGNAFTGAVSLTNSGANVVTLDNGTHALILGAVTAGSGALSLLSTDAIVLTDDITTSGSAVALGAPVKLDAPSIAISTTGNGAAGGNIVFDDTLDNATSTAGSLTVNAGNGNVTFSGAVGSDVSNGAVGALVVNSSGQTSFGGTVAAASLATDTGGSTMLGDKVSTTGAQTYGDAVTLAGNVTLASSGNGAITLDDTVTGAHDLAVNTGGISTFNGAVNVASLSTDATGSTTLSGGVGTTGTQTYGDAVTLAGDVTLASSGNGAITLDDTVTGAYDLAVNTGGISTFNGAVNVASLSTDATGSTTLGGGVSTTGAQTYGDAVTLAGNVTLASSGSGAITLDDTVDGAHDLAVNTGGGTTFNGTVNVANLTTDAIGGTLLGDDVTTSGAQSYGDSVTLGKDMTLAGSSVSLAGVSGGGHALTVTGDATLAGALADVTTLSVSGSTGIGTAGVSTSGNQLYSGAVTLSGDADLTSSAGNVTFGGTVDNADSTARALTVEALAGTVSFGGPVGELNGSLRGLASSSGSFDAGRLSIGDDGLSVTTSTVDGITQSDRFIVTGSSSFDAGGQAIDLSDAANELHGAIALNGGNVSVVNHRATILGAGTVSGVLDVSSTGALTQTGALTVDGAATFTQNSTVAGASQDVNLGSQDNDFKGSVTFAAATGEQIHDLSLRNTGATPGVLVMPASVAGDLSLDYTATGLTLSGVNVGGALSVGAAGAIGQSGVLVVGGAATFTQNSTTAGASQDIDLGQSNDFQGGVTFATGAGAQIRNLSLKNTGTAAAALNMPAGVTGDLALNYTAAGFTLSGTSVGGALSVTAAGQIDQSGALVVGGTTTIDAGDHVIKLDDAHNDFQADVTATGTGVSITDVNDLTIDTLSNGSNGTVSLIAGGALLLPTGAIDTGTADLTLAANGGTLIAPGALSGANVTLSSQGDITLSDAVTATGTLSLTSLAGAIGQSTGSLAAAELTGSSHGTTLLGGTNYIDSLGDFSASGFSLTNSQGLAIDGVVDGGSSTALTTLAGDLAINGTLKGTAVTLTSAGAIGEGAYGVIEATTLTGSSQGNTVLGGANLVDTLGNFSAANFSLVNAQGLATSGALTTTGGSGNISLETSSGTLNLGSDLAGGAISLASADDLVLANNITGSTVELVSSGGSISQSAGTLTAGTLSGSAVDGVVLGQANQVTALGDFSADGFDLTNSVGLAVNGVVDGGGNTALTTLAGDLTINGTLKGTAVTLTSAGAIDEGVSGVVEAATLTGSSQGNTALGGANLVDTLDNFDAANFSLVNAKALAANGALTTTGGSGSISLKTSSGTLSVNSDLAGGAVALTSAGDLALTNDIDATSVALAAGGNISQGASVIHAGTLTGQSTGTTILDGANLIGTLGGFQAANFSLINATGLSVNGPLQITSPSGGVSLATTTGILTVNSVLSAGAVSLSSAGDLALAHEVSGSLVTLASGGNISQTASGNLTATTLTGHSAGSTTLNGSGNRIGTLDSFTAAGFSLTNNQSLSVTGPVNGGASTTLATTAGNLAINGVLNGTTTTFGVAGAISQGTSGVITANLLRGSATGAVALGGGNHIGVLGDFSAAGFSLKNAQDLTVAGVVNGGASTALATTGNLVINGTLSGATTTLDVAGAISEASAGGITAGTLKGGATGAVSLTGANHIGALGNFSAAYLNLRNAQSLVVAGTVDGGTSTTLTTTGGDLTINGALKGTAMALNSAGAIGEGSHGVITAATLTGRSTGAATLNGANRVGILGSFDAASLDLTNAQALAVNGPLTVANGGRLHLATTSGLLSVNTALSGGDVALASAGSLALTQAVQGNTVALLSGGGISQTANGVVTAGTLTGHSVGSTALDSVNHVDALGSFSAAGFALATDRALTVTGPLDGGSDVTLATTHGDLTINGLVNGTRTTLTSAGAINEGSTGGIGASTLGGSSAGATTLGGSGNRVATLESFRAAGFSFTNGQSLVVAGPLDGGARTTLTTTRGGDLSIDGAVQGGVTTLVSAGALSEGAGGSITAGTLTGSAVGIAMLGDAAHPLANYIGTLGGFSALAGFSLTNDQTLTLASVNGSGYTVDAGNASTYLSVIGGDLQQTDKAWLYNGLGTWSSTGHIGAAGAPIYVIGGGAQTIATVGAPPAYFYALDRQGNLLPLTGGTSINVPTSALTSRAQNTNKHTDSYIDPSVISANYRAFGIVPSGLLLPPDQQRCAVDAMDCDDE